MRFSPTTALLGSLVFLSGAAFAAVTPYRAIAGVEVLGLPNATFGLLMGLSAVVSATAAVVLGWVSDRVKDRRMILMFCAAIGAVAFGLVWAIPSPTVFAAVFVLLIPFGNALFSQSFSYARAYYDQSEPARAQFIMSLLRSGFTLAWIVVPPLAGWVAAQGTAFSAFGLAAIAHVGCTVAAVLLWGQSSGAIATVATGATQGRPQARPRISRAHKFGVAGIALALSALQLNMVVLPMVIVRDLSGSMTQVGLTSALAAAIEVPAMIGWGYLAMRIDKEIILAIASASFAAYFGLVLVAASIEVILIAQLLAAVAIAALLSINISYLQEAIPGRIGLSTSLVDVTRVLSVWVAAAVFALNPGTTYAPLMGFAGMFCLVAIGLLVVARRLRLAA